MRNFNITFDFSGQTALITGGATGIGFTVAQLFARAGANLVLVDKNEAVATVAKDLAKDTGVEALGVAVDITEMEQLQSLKQQSLSAFTKVDILLNNAGVGLVDDAVTLSKETWDTTMAVNLGAPFFVTQTFVPEMIERKKGKIINIASQAAVIALEKHGAYCPSKAGVVSMTKVMALEWGKYNINVNAVSPTITNTEMTVRVWSGKVGDDFKAKMPIQRFADPEEIGMAVLFLASNASDMIHGENILIDGGYSIQ